MLSIRNHSYGAVLIPVCIIAFLLAFQSASYCNEEPPLPEGISLEEGFVLPEGFSLPEGLTLEDVRNAGIKLEGAPLTLQKAIELGLEKSRSVKISALDYESSQNKVSETRARFGFDLKVESNYQRVHDPTTFGFPVNPMAGEAIVPFNQKWQHAAEVKLTKPVFTFGKRKDSIRAAGKDREIKKLDIELARLDLVLDVKESFYKLLLAYRAVETVIRTANQAQEHFDAAESRFEVGTSPRLDVIRAQGDVEQSRENLIKAQKHYELAQMALNHTIGLSVKRSTWVLDTGAYEKVMLKLLQHYYDLAFSSRQELKQIEFAEDLARISARLAKKKPMVSLAGTWNFHNRGSGFASEHSWRGILYTEMPIFDNGLARSKEAQARRLEDKLILQETDLREGIMLQVKKAYLDLMEAEQRIETSKAILETAEEGYRMADIGFKEGVTAQIDLLDAESSLTNARLNRAVADHDYQIAKAHLARACGLESLKEAE